MGETKFNLTAYGGGANVNWENKASPDEAAKAATENPIDTIVARSETFIEKTDPPSLANKSATVVTTLVSQDASFVTENKVISGVKSFFTETLPNFGKSINERISGLFNQKVEIPSLGENAKSFFTETLPNLGRATSEKTSGLFKEKVQSPPKQLSFEEIEAEIDQMKPVDFESKKYIDMMKDKLENVRNVLGIKINNAFKVMYELATRTEDGQATATIDNEKVYKFGKTRVKGEKLNELKKTTRVTFSQDTLVDGTKASPQSLKSIFQKGARSFAEQIQSSARCVVSLNILTSNNRGDIDWGGKPPPEFPVYTMNAPNLAYNEASKQALTKTEEGNLKLDEPKYKAEMKRVFKHFLSECKKDNVEIPLIPALGLRSFMISALRPAAAKLFLEALKEAADEVGGNFEQIIVTGNEFADVSNLEEIEKGLKNDKIMLAGHGKESKDSFDVLEFLLKQGKKVGYLIAGDPSGQTGQFANLRNNHIRAEEAAATHMPGLMITQGAGHNPDVMLNETNYQAA
jgi:hypothetical protein